MKPFVKWAGGKRWLLERADFRFPNFPGRYIEPFLGDGAVFFKIQPRLAILADLNLRLIETYQAIAANPAGVRQELRRHQRLHSPEYYYQERSVKRRTLVTRAGQFLYLNRTCWNGLYRENLKGQFNVPIGTKSEIFNPDEDLAAYAAVLARAEIRCQDFEKTLASAREGDFVFIDPPYTAAHNNNGFIKYNQKIFRWEDQLRLRESVLAASERGALIYMTNADHPSIERLYSGVSQILRLNRASVISGSQKGRGKTTELLIRI